MLPSRTQERRSASAQELDGRYADEAITLLAKEIDAAGIPHREYQVKVFGGGNMFPGRTNAESNVGFKNVETARNLVAKHGFNCVAEHLGGYGHRNVIFDVWDGQVWVKHAPISGTDAAVRNVPGQATDRRIPCAAFA